MLVGRSMQRSAPLRAQRSPPRDTICTQRPHVQAAIPCTKVAAIALKRTEGQYAPMEFRSERCVASEEARHAVVAKKGARGLRLDMRATQPTQYPGHIDSLFMHSLDTGRARGMTLVWRRTA